MEIHEYFDKKRDVYNQLLAFIENESENEIEIEEEFTNLIDYIESNELLENESEFILFFNLLINISNHHHRTPDFNSKIEKILNFIISKPYFHSLINKLNLNPIVRNKQIFLFFLQNKIIKMNSRIINFLMQNKQHLFFIDKIKPLINNDRIKQSIEKEISELDQNIFFNFENKRKNGENDSYICELIRNDMIKEFIIYINRTNISHSSTIKPSIYETNLFLINKNPTLIEYSAFFGSIQIFQYLLFNRVELTPSLWLYSIHSNKPELIHLLEDNCVKPPNDSYEICFEEAIKCHHNDMANYFNDNYLINTNEFDFFHNSIYYCFKYDNFSFLPNDFDIELIFFYACKYNYLNLFKLLLNRENIDVNKVIIFKKNYFYSSNSKNLVFNQIHKSNYFK